MAVLTVIHNGIQQQIDAQVGDTVLAVLQRAGIAAPEAPCGGNGTCKKCLVSVDGREVLACRTAVTGDHTVIIPEWDAGAVIIGEGAAAELPLTPADGLGAAADIGTTTVVVYLYDLRTGKLLGTTANVTETFVRAMREFLGEENVVLK